MTACLTASGVCKSYGSSVALRDVSLEVRRGEIVALLGPNGSGKTTLIKILATLLSKDAGKVEILGCDLDVEETAIRNQLGYVGQDSDRSAYARLSVRENLQFFGALRGLDRNRIDTQIGSLAACFEFEPQLDHLFMTLSGGQKQTTVIMRALLADPPLIFLDEPTKGLDPFMAKRIRQLLKRYVEGGQKSILLTSHALSDVDELADSVALIHAGRIEVRGTAAQLKAAVGVQTVIEFTDRGVSASIRQALLAAGGKPLAPENSWGWNADSMDGVLQVLRDHGLESQYCLRPISLEDAFVYHVGRLEERFDG